jgi:hypothetical protein
MPFADMIGGTGVSEVRVDVRVHARVGKMDVCPHDPIFEGLGLVIPLAAAVHNASLHCQDSIVLMHEGMASFRFLVKANDFCLDAWVI